MRRGRRETRGPATALLISTLLTGINFLAFRQSKIYIRFGPTKHHFFSEGVIGSEPPFQKSSKPVVATDGTGFSRHHFLRGLSWDRDFFIAATGGSTLRGS
jgi:hypothetical protein